MTSADTEILTVDDLAQLFACDKETASARLKCGDLPGVKVGRGWIIPRQALFERLNEMAREEAATRREQLRTMRDAAQERCPATHPAPPSRKPSVAGVLNNLDVVARGRKRRIPPPLPQIPLATEPAHLLQKPPAK